MIIIEQPDNFHKERSYVLDTIFKRWLKLDYTIKWSDIDFFKIKAPATTKYLRLPDTFFQKKST